MHKQRAYKHTKILQTTIRSDVPYGIQHWAVKHQPQQNNAANIRMAR
jgi:hypothetical protein